MDKWKKTIMHMGAYPAALGKWVLLGGIIGVAGGVIGSLFHIGVNYATAIRGAHPWILYLLPVGGLAIVGLYKLCHLEGKGTNAIIESVHFGESVPILLVPVIFVSTVITHLCGGSAGREGAALQIGGGLGYEAGKLLHLGEKDLPLATLCGMSGVFSALFCSAPPSPPRCSPWRSSAWGFCTTRAWCPASPPPWRPSACPP